MEPIWDPERKKSAELLHRSSLLLLECTLESNKLSVCELPSLMNKDHNMCSLRRKQLFLFYLWNFAVPPSGCFVNYSSENIKCFP